ncbi:MAG: hypothetical protein FJ318_09685 [SAR202 cluster bacterium]|nr:hypothetical protein [SAR202 cluster bacterium]
MDDIITMDDMALVYEVTDELGIDREHLRVDLTKEDPGRFAVVKGGFVEMTLPASKPLAAWLREIQPGLRQVLPS